MMHEFHILITFQPDIHASFSTKLPGITLWAFDQDYGLLQPLHSALGLFVNV